MDAEEETLEKHTVTIVEVEDGWLVSLDGRTPHLSPTAAETLASVREYSRDQVRDRHPNAVMVTWEPTTRIGRMVVEALC